MTETTPKWRSLAEAASVEMDSEKLNALVEKLIQTLDSEAGLRQAGDFSSTSAA